MIFHRLHQIIILLIYLSLSATSYGYTFEHKIENYGLTFAAHTVDQDHRTSLILNSGKGISFPAEGFIMNFDIKLRQELYTYGYILRVISHNDQNLDLVSYLYDSKISIISGSSHEKSQMVYLADSMLIRKDQWMPIQIQFFPNSAKIKINGKNIYLSHSFRDFNDVQIIFGASNLGRFFSGDVAPMSIRNLSLQSLQGKTFYYWKLDRSSKTTNNFVYDSISDLPAYVKNGKWEIDKHYHWQRVTSFEIDYKNPQLAFDEIKGNFFVASDKKLYTYNVNNKTLDTLSFKGAPFLGVSSQMLFHPLKKTLLSYNIYHNKLNWFNPTTSSWSVNQKITVDDNQHHNRFFDKDHDKLYLYGGYGRHQYSGALYEYNLKDNFKWSQMNLDTLISPRYLSALGKYSDNKLLVLGGYGSHSGKQEDFPQNFYDLYLLNLNTGTCKKLWEMNHTDEHFVMGNSAIVDTLTNSIYALTYRNDCYNTAIYLSQFLIKTNRPIRQIVSDSILYKFRDIYSYCDLFYHPNDTSLYAVILEPSKNESSLCRIYKLAFPPLIPTKTSYIESAPFKSSMERWKHQQAYRWGDFIWGYQVEGRFENMDQVNTFPIQNGDTGNLKELPGDFVLKDVNGDGVINDMDKVPLFWSGTPLLHYGLNLQASWKNFDFYMLFQGSAMYTVQFDEVYAKMLCFKGGNTPEYFYDRWHREDPYDENSAWIPGEWPAIRLEQDMGSLYTRDTDVWRKNASYLRLKTIEIGYTFKQKFLKDMGLGDLRVYVNGNNLFTICNSFVKPFDPEKIEGNYSAGLNYPLSKIFNVGFTLNF